VTGSRTSPGEGTAPGAPRRRRVPPALPGLLGVAGALLALSTLGVTWLRRRAEGPLGAAGDVQAELLSGRDVAPLVAALLPGVAAVVAVGLLLRGAARVVALALAAVGAGAAGVSAAGVALGTEPGTTVTAAPWVAVVACALVAVGAAASAVLTARATSAGPRTTPAPVAGRAAPQAPPAPAAAPGAEASQADLWRAMDEGRDPTREGGPGRP
jgi:hypothetical protein